MSKLTPTGIIFDLDGVLESAQGLEPGALELWDFLSATSVRSVILTNDIRPCCFNRVEELAAWGLAVSTKQFITPYSALDAALCAYGLDSPCFIGTAVPPELLQSREPYDCIVLTDVAHSFDRLEECTELLRTGLPLFALQKNPVLGLGGQVAPDVGYHIAGWEFCLGVQAEILGKPGRFAYASALSALALPASQVIMLSDSASTDLVGAEAIGIEGVLVAKYARHSERVLASSRFRVVASLEELLRELN